MNIKGTLIFENINRVLIEIAFLRDAVRNLRIFTTEIKLRWSLFFRQNTIENILND